MKSMKKALLAIAAATLMGVLPGCGSSRTGGETSDGSAAKAAAPFGVDAQNRPYVGADKCIECHVTISAAVVTDYLLGKHVIHDQTVDAAMAGDGCFACHDPIGDGRRLEGLIATNDVPAAGLAAVTCEACHGAGGQHYGTGPIPTATPDYTVCGKCHNADFATTTTGHAAFTEASNILADYTASPHNTGEMRNNQICVKCHTDEGGRRYKNVTTWDALSTTLPIDGDTHPVQCRTCHNAHNPGELLKAATSTASAVYNTCTNCHQKHNAQVTVDPDPLAGTADGASGDLIYHAKRWDRVISSTHYDDPATNNADGNAKIEGYVMSPASEHVCLDCHNVHSAAVTINDQWASSGHGGDLLTIKAAAAAGATDSTFVQVQAVRAAGSTSSWAADPWADDANAECQRCHTATGGKNFMIDSDAYHTSITAFITAVAADTAGVTSPNDFSYLQSREVVTTKNYGKVTHLQQEMLFCWACHADNSGTLRIQANVNLIDRNQAIFATIPAHGKSTVCIGCHGGRANDTYLKNTLPAQRRSSARVHNLTAAGFLFSAQTHSGYEFAGKDYTDKSYFVHNGIGMNGDSPETGDGPCASCHMPDANHSLQAITEDALGAITAINNQPLCAGCHLGTGAMTTAALEAKRTGFEAAMTLLQGYVQNTIPNYLNLPLDNSTNLQTAPVTSDAYGAEQNYQALASDPGVYVHNSIYAKRLIFDSINLLKNGDLSATTLDLSGYDDAYNYLVTYPTGTEKPPITAMTRP